MSNGTVDAFTHTLAISLARELNLINPNDLLAQRVTDLCKAMPDLPAFAKAVATFGKFREDYVAQIHREIKGHLFGVQPVEGLDPAQAVSMGGYGSLKVEDADVMMPDAATPGGLRAGLHTDHKHVFTKPSLLGLDKLAAIKREERDEASERDRKRPRVEESMEQLQAEFKSSSLSSHRRLR
jgi:pre-mRNA-splicing factor ATP-dependent RNA helicase DHX38/PRP16